MTTKTQIPCIQGNKTDRFLTIPQPLDSYAKLKMLMAAGPSSSSSSVRVVSFVVTLSDLDISSFDKVKEATFKSEISAKLGVPPACVKLSAAAGSVCVDVSVEFEDAKAAGVAMKVVASSDAVSPLVSEDHFGPCSVSDVSVVTPAEKGRDPSSSSLVRAHSGGAIAKTPEEKAALKVPAHTTWPLLFSLSVLW